MHENTPQPTAESPATHIGHRMSDEVTTKDRVAFFTEPNGNKVALRAGDRVTIIQAPYGVLGDMYPQEMFQLEVTILKCFYEQHVLKSISVLLGRIPVTLPVEHIAHIHHIHTPEKNKA